MAIIKQHMPKYYKNSTVVDNLTTPIDLENENTIKLINETIDQFYVSTATEKTLNRYEENYGLPINPSGLTLDERRSRIKAKMRMYGVVNKEMIQSVVNAWSNADVEITEDYSNYTVIIEFVNSIGIPSNMDNVYEAVNEIIPAHLIVIYIFKYRQHVDLKPYTHQYLGQYTHEQIRSEGVI